MFIVRRWPQKHNQWLRLRILVVRPASGDARACFYDEWFEVCVNVRGAVPFAVFFFSLTHAPVNHRQVNSWQAMDRDNLRLILDNSPGTEIKRGLTGVVNLLICRSIIWITVPVTTLPSTGVGIYPCLQAVVGGLRVNEVYEGATSIVLGLSLLSALSQSHSIFGVGMVDCMPHHSWNLVCWAARARQGKNRLKPKTHKDNSIVLDADW